MLLAVNSIFKPKFAYLCAVCSSIIIVYFSYVLNRSNFIPLMLCYFLFCFFNYSIYRTFAGAQSTILFKVGVFLRVLLLFSIPNLSQDFYRFIWDGRLLLNGYNPYLYTPQTLINQPFFQLSEAKILYNSMGSLSASHYTNYPPVNQICFLLAALVSYKSITGSILIFKILLLFSDIGIYYFGKKILLLLSRNTNLIYWYFLNPLVIVELAGNAHFEGLMLFFWIFSLYFLSLKKYPLSAIFLGISIATKLLPLLWLPLYVNYLGIKKGILYCSIAVAVVLAAFMPFLSINLASNYMQTISLWFINFEFNASIYYLIRAIGYKLSGFNIIKIFGTISPILIIAVIFRISGYKKINSLFNLLIAMLYVLSFYFFISTTVHPWYLINLVLLSVFTGYTFPIVFSISVILSYSAYKTNPAHENFYLIMLEYVPVYITLIFNIKNFKHKVKLTTTHN